jgi:hypothetical protein
MRRERRTRVVFEPLMYLFSFLRALCGLCVQIGFVDAKIAEIAEIAENAENADGV